MKVNLLFLLILILAFFSCQNREWNNPFDPDCPKDFWTPSNFIAIQKGTTIELNWKQNINNISGFHIERKVGNMGWLYISLDKNSSSWIDLDITGGKVHEYQLTAEAGNNLSNSQILQITPLFPATLSTSFASMITSTTAVLGGTITSDGGAFVTERGICWATSENPTIGNNKFIIGNGTGNFSSTITGFSPNTNYYVRAYAKNMVEIAYGVQISFLTPQSSILPAPEALWTFDDCTPNDFSGNNHNGIFYGTPPTCLLGIFSNSSFFSNKSLSYFDSPMNLNINSSSFTISFWVKFLEGDDYDPTFLSPFFTLESGNTDNGNHLFFINRYNSNSPNNTYWAIDTYQDGFLDIYTNTDYLGLTNGSWHHFALSCSKSNVTLFMDGIMLSSFVAPSILFDRISAGADHQKNVCYDQIRYYNVDLSATQIQYIYKNHY